MSQQKYDDPDDDPEVIRARADARAQILEARSKLHPLSQLVYTIIDGADDMLRGIGCILIILILVIAIFAPQLFDLILRR